MTSPVTITWSPAARTSRSSQATETSESSIAGTPSRSDQETPAHFSATGALVAKERATGSWPWWRTLTPKRSAAWTASRVREPRSRQASISIGSIESEQTALAVAPAGPSGPLAVTIVTPVGRFAIAARKLAESGGGIVRRSRSALDNMMRAACVQYWS